MRTETLFYLFGGFFIIAATVYFTWDYVIAAPKEIKILILAALTTLFFFLGNVLKKRGI